MAPPLLEIRNLEITFGVEGKTLHAVDGVSLAVEQGRTLGIVGESGCGKSVTAHAVLRLVPSPPGRIDKGEILWKGRDLLGLSAREMTAVRGTEIAMIFQDPMTSLNPVMSVERQMGEILRRRYGIKGAAAHQRLLAVLGDVGIGDAERRLDNYPHELSGGMKQRIMIAMALLHEPELLIADEPTTALDVTIQKQILHLMRELKSRRNMALVLITHDLGVVAETCDDVAVMYAGRVVERAPIVELFEHPRHHYTRGLLASIPRRGLDKSTPLPTIEGTVPALFSRPVGCRFADRCGRAEARCRTEDPAMQPVGTGHEVACHFPAEAPL